MYKRLALGSALLLAACNGGDGDSQQSQSVPLTTRADALRELGILVSVVGIDDGQADSSAKRSGTAAKAESAALAKATQTENCDSGTRTITDGSAERTFEFFAVQRTVAFERIDADNCFTDGLPEVTVNGVFEDGAAATDANGSNYSYVMYGADGDAVTVRFEPSDSDDPDSFVDSRLKGLSESSERNGTLEIRTVSRINAAGYSTALGDIDVEMTVGRDGDPLVDIEGNGAQTLDGPYSYSSNRCSGGALQVETLSPLRFADSSLNGGSVRVTSGDTGLTYTFNADGSAALQFADGSVGTLTRAEVQDIYLNDSTCVDN